MQNNRKRVCVNHHLASVVNLSELLGTRSLESGKRHEYCYGDRNEFDGCIDFHNILSFAGRFVPSLHRMEVYLTEKESGEKFVDPHHEE